MPTVLRKDGFQFMIFVDDHEPPHVHARRDRAIVVINLGVNGGPPSLRLVAENNDVLLEAWRSIHG